jgi:septum formation protein
MALVLASTSSYRAKLLARLAIPFEISAPEVDEREFDREFTRTSDEELATAIARAKAQSVAKQRPSDVILAADQIAVLPVQPGIAARTLLHKPGERERAIAQLMLLSGRTHRLVTGLALIDGPTGRTSSECDAVELTMRAFERAEAEAYVDACSPLDCVGSYRIEDAGIWLFERVAGADPTSIMGLPLLKVCALLRGVR